MRTKKEKVFNVAKTLNLISANQVKLEDIDSKSNEILESLEKKLQNVF